MFKKITCLLKQSNIIVENHIFMTFVNIISFFLFLFPFLYTLIFYEWNNKIFGFIYFIPFLLVWLISWFSSKNFYKYNWLSRFFNFVLNFGIIIFSQIIIVVLVFTIINVKNQQEKYSNVKNYEQAIKIFAPDKISHFPKILPVEAKNSKLKTTISPLSGERAIYLQFDIDKNFIKDELNKYTFIDKKNYEETLDYKCYYRFYNHVSIPNSFKYYIIQNSDNDNINEHLIYHRGIGVSKNQKQILYYYQIIND